jgi:hypothetical protein
MFRDIFRIRLHLDQVLELRLGRCGLIQIKIGLRQMQPQI